MAIPYNDLPDLLTKSTQELRKICRTEGMKGLPGALVDRETAIEYLHGRIKLKAAIEKVFLQHRKNPELIKWAQSKMPNLLGEEKTMKQETVKQETVKQETVKQETVKQETVKQETAQDELDPRRHENWKLLVDVSRSMGVPLEKALERYADEYRARIGDLEEENAKLKRNGIPEHSKDDYGVSPMFEPSEEILDALWYVEQANPVLLVGPAGSGKSMGLRWICKQLKRRMIMLSMHGHVMADTMEGYSWLTVKEGVTSQEWVRGVLQIALEDGAVLICDEIDRAPTAIQHMLNDVAQSKSMTFKEGPLAGTTIKGKPGFLILGTANTINGSTGEFTSTAVDKSTLSRFRVIRVDYDTKAESKLLKAIGVNPDLASKITKAFSEARREAKQGNLFTPPGTRHLEKIAQDIAGGLSPVKAWRYNVSNMQTEDIEHPFWKKSEAIGRMIV